MTNEEFLKLEGQKIFVLLIKSMLSGKITPKQAHKKFDEWFIANGFLNTGTDFLGWVRTDQIEFMGIYEDDKGNWHYETEIVEVEKKTMGGTITTMIEVSRKYQDWERMKRLEEENRGYTPAKPSEALNLFNTVKETFGGKEIK